MASMATHFTTFLFLCPVGIRRLLFSCSVYQRNPSLYCSRIWYFSEPKWKNFDIYILLIALPIVTFSQIFIFLAFSGNPTTRFLFLEQSFVSFVFWVLLVWIILKESLDLSSIPENFVFIFAGIAFVIEFYMNTNGMVGLGGLVYGIYGGLCIFCASCCICLSIRPSAFSAEFLLSSGLVLKGTWALQMGLSLYTDYFVLKGCTKISGSVALNGKTDIKCDLEADRFRGIALMNLFFFVHVIAIMIVSVVLFSVLHLKRNMKSAETSGPLLSGKGSEARMMLPLPEFEIE